MKTTFSLIPIAILIGLTFLTSCSSDEPMPSDNTPIEGIKSKVNLATDSTLLSFDTSDYVSWEIYTNENGERVVSLPMKVVSDSDEMFKDILPFSTTPNQIESRTYKPILTVIPRQIANHLWEMQVGYGRLGVYYQTMNIYEFPRHDKYRVKYLPRPNEVVLEAKCIPSGKRLSVMAAIHDINDETMYSYTVGFDIKIEYDEYILERCYGIEML